MSAMEFHKWVVHDALRNVAFGKRSQDMSLCGAHVFFVPIETKMTVPLLVFYFWALVVFFPVFVVCLTHARGASMHTSIRTYPQ